MTQELSASRKTIVGVQFLFVAFGSTVLVPLLVGLDPATALFTAGIGTFIFHLVTKGQVPIYLGSSFAFIAPIISASQQWGMPGTIAGIAGVALVYFLMSALIKWQGRKLLDTLFPPVVIGPVIILIGLSLSPAAVNMAKENWLLAFISLISAILVLVFGRGLVKLVPVVIGIVVGYIVALCMGLIDLSAVATAPWFALPPMIAHFQLPQFAWEPFVFMIPVAIAPVIEHIGDVYVVGAVAEKDFVKDPGLHRTMLGDGLACLFASFVGGPPVTTYSEVTGAMQITHVTHPHVIRIAAGTAIVFSVIGKLSALLQSIPSAVLGGIMLLLFGSIASVGVQNLINHKVDLNQTRNIIIVSVTLTMGIGGAVLTFGTFSISGIGLSACTQKRKAEVTLQVKTQYGILEGFEQDGVKKFLGVPFAQAPVGELRWKAPQPVLAWEGIREAKDFGDDPMQPNIFGDMQFRGSGRSEDCLYLNIWTTAKTTADALPVLIYFNGGGLMAGSGSEPRYDGSSIAKEGVIGVTANYREGVFGFFAHPELTEASDYKGSGNYGFLDQVAAIQWVKENIAAFGGDPDRITIVGESAGSFSVSLLMCSPLSKNLIAGAMLSSGAEVLP